VCGFDVAQVFESGEVVEILPGGEPKPLCREQATLRRKKQRNQKGGKKQDRGMFVEKAEAKEYAAPEKELGLLAVDGEKQNIDATHPEERFNRIHGEAGAVAEDHGGEKHGNACEENGPALAA
jgi:hypothetical protein